MHKMPEMLSTLNSHSGTTISAKSDIATREREKKRQTFIIWVVEKKANRDRERKRMTRKKVHEIIGVCSRSTCKITTENRFVGVVTATAMPKRPNAASRALKKK